MEFLGGVMAVTTVCLAGFVTLRGAGAAAQVMTEMFKSPANLGWPSGVQEDDDFRWRWSGLPAALPDDLVAPLDIVELPNGTGPHPSRVWRQ